jgi:hypothetical protein
MNKNLTEIVFILDESGSMGSVKDDTIGGFNEFIEQQKNIKGEAVFTFVKFSDYYKVIEEGSLLESVKPLNKETYTPSYSTALLDAVGKTINKVGNRHDTLDEEDKPGKVLFVIMTDGYENSSKEFVTEGVISKMVKNKKSKNDWEFLFLGADIDAWSAGQNLGFSKGRTVTTNKNKMSKNYKSLSHFTASYRTGGQMMDAADSFNMDEADLDTEISKMSKNKK